MLKKIGIKVKLYEERREEVKECALHCATAKSGKWDVGKGINRKNSLLNICFGIIVNVNIVGFVCKL